jgi:hypothetical protein
MLPVTKEAAQAASLPPGTVLHEMIRVLEVTLQAVTYHSSLLLNDYLQAPTWLLHYSMSTHLVSLTNLFCALIVMVGSTTVVLMLTMNPWLSISRVTWWRGRAA